MTKIKLCGLKTIADIDAANEIKPEYIGFVFARSSRRYVTPGHAHTLKARLDPAIQAVGVFVNEDPDLVADLLNQDIIDIAQLHGTEDEEYIRHLRSMTDRPLIRAFKIRSPEDVSAAERSSADLVLLDAGAGTGTVFDWTLLHGFTRPYLLAGGLCPENAAEAVKTLHPWGVDVSSGIETGGSKDHKKMAAFAAAVRRVNP